MQMRCVAIFVATLAIANAARLRAVDQCTEGFEGANATMRCTALVQDLKIRSDELVNNTALTLLLKESEKCKKLKAKLEYYEDMQKRCETPQDAGPRGLGEPYGGKENCWPRLKEVLPKYIARAKELIKENKC
eukprot:gnl/MRDRNA2_/MRDRNA2_88146_c0_seq1.p1 gnl/MRDRNA2_/MRDRNA2_88146_c0~~gnl/MRDRNA2_/MRDRNA2_88146_c0_seq1.p1  ORF type:complete len:133 (-),score=23.38 gnl/MRDRNA2_/MRDRNA2_88146_c0_seq1:13-411(-)